MVKLFDKDVRTVGELIKKIYAEKEVQKANYPEFPDSSAREPLPIDILLALSRWLPRGWREGRGFRRRYAMPCAALRWVPASPGLRWCTFVHCVLHPLHRQTLRAPQLKCFLPH